MAVLYHRVRCLKLLKSLHMEKSFSILRRMPGIATLSTKAGNPKKPIRYTSIKKAKPQTIVDIGNLLLQRATKPKESQQLVIGEVVLKPATQTASNSMATIGPVPANSKTVAAKKPVIKAVPELSVISTPTFTTTVAKCADSLFETTTCVKKVEETVPEASVTRDNRSTKASASSELSPPVSTAFSVSLKEMTEGTHVPSNVIDETTNTRHAIPETGAALAPETYFGILPSGGTVIPTTGKVSDLSPNLSPDLSPAVNGSTEATAVSGDIEIIHAPKDATSTRAVHGSEVNEIMPMQEGASVENLDGPNTCTHRIPAPLTITEVKNSQTQGIASELSATGEIINVQDLVQHLCNLQSPMTTETSTDSSFTTCSSQIPYKEETIGHKLTPDVETGSPETAFRLPFTDPVASPVVPNKDSAVQVVAPEEVAVFTSQPKIMDASAEKGPDVTPETVFERNIICSNKCLMTSDPANAELAEEELKTEGERSVQEVLEAQLDPIQKLFLDKIREFSTKSKYAQLYLHELVL
ncbi:uncharacterized protein LOC128602406 isoform X3 [Ictalurus furcatus]|uniref:uncharacterized protein LOC128602406 isoform X3 n=1 Tax=Ictalurus furcatus TaxID=66913 RepID=UPI002350233C|nr:uncharacterized protein LOC128602406 isoform X3 [Ictalurus furcatus]